MTETAEADTSWMEMGACTNENPEIWWIDPEVGDNPYERFQKTRMAKRICEECPVWQECRQWGLTEAVQDRWSVLGGLTARERRMLRQP